MCGNEAASPHNFVGYGARRQTGPSRLISSDRIRDGSVFRLVARQIPQRR
jgi:hypothetical protein